MKEYIKKLIQRKDGFTLVELLIVIAIIAILAAIAIPQFTRYKDKAYDSELRSDAHNSYTAAIAYLTDFPAETIDSAAKLSSGGYTKSSNIVAVTAGTMTTSAGSFTIISTAYAGLSGNVATVMWNGNINYN